MRSGIFTLISALGITFLYWMADVPARLAAAGNHCSSHWFKSQILDYHYRWW